MEKQKADAILSEYLPKLYGFAIQKSFSYAEAEELCAEIVGELYFSLRKAGEIYNLEGYVWRISQHTYSKYVSSKKKHAGISLDEITIPFIDRYTFEEEGAEESIRLRREIAFLTSIRREIVFSYYYENKKVAQIAREKGLPEGSVKWHLSQAREEMRKGFMMERKIGKLGIQPIQALSIGHDGTPGTKGGPEAYLSDRLSLNLVYSVYFAPKTREEIAGELGVTPVFIDERLELLEANGFLVRQAKDRFTTYVRFFPETYSNEFQEKLLKKRLEIAQILVRDYLPAVRSAIAGVTDLYIPGGNRELFEAAVCCYAVLNKCMLPITKDLSQYVVKTTDGGSYVVNVELPAHPSDPDYTLTLSRPDDWACGSMRRYSDKYPVSSWSLDSRFCSREGMWQNNLCEDYDYLYEFMTGSIVENEANAEKFKRLRSRQYLTEDDRVNILVVKGEQEDFFSKIPELDDSHKKLFADFALEMGSIRARDYPVQMRDLVVGTSVRNFVDNRVALMVKDILYGNGIFRPLTENERVTSDLLMFSDRLPKE